VFFRDVIGQDEVKRRLLTEVAENRVPHAQLFCGPAGCGKLPMAIAYARYLLCEHPGEDEACGTCPSCVKLNKLAHPDLHFVFPIIRPKGTSAQRVLTSDDYLSEWRTIVAQDPYFDIDQWLEAIDAENQQALIYGSEGDAIQRKLSLKSMGGGRKVMIIWLPEKMHVVCANKLLKLLEEPPAQTVFLLVSEAPDQLLPTILSRTQRIDFRRLADEEIVEALVRRNGVGEENARQVAHLAGGSYQKAVQTLRVNQDSELFFNLFVLLMRLGYQRKIKEMRQWSEQIATMGRERQKNFLDYSQHLVRENFVYNFRRPELNYMNGQEGDFARNFARFINERNVISIMEELQSARRDIVQNTNPRMVFFDFALKITMLLRR
jgi:DNA polymerase-3 subunit delta'